MFFKTLVLRLVDAAPENVEYSHAWSQFNEETLKQSTSLYKDLQSLRSNPEENDGDWKDFYFDVRKSQESYVKFWKELFCKLYTATEDQVQESLMWNQFRKEEIKKLMNRQFLI